MRTAFVLLRRALLSIAVSVCSASFAEDRCDAPNRFRAEMGGYLGASYAVELKGDDIQYSVLEPGSHSPTVWTIKPTESQWCDFRQTLDGVGVWGWREQYLNYNVLDGSHWDLDIAYKDHALKTRGINDYPKSFMDYQLAVEKLVGGKLFR